MIELPIRDPCDLCETASREERWAIIEESEHTLTVINPWQFEVGQCCVITRRHVALLLDLSDAECAEVMRSARRVAEALVKSYRPLGILTFQNNGVYSGQERRTSISMSCPGRWVVTGVLVHLNSRHSMAPGA